ncbi:CD99 antigen-like protein 2 isoform X3 [Pristis pectinata]|uniref:CD99 antigen-like protein 2 isoform X2 n=1 Tax=Pristis pectinata TaxID=685728 RepID=UPI00223DDD30|nr:CD99 antigen-like protein 2 isoform X2 [Pristis pectinata]XP_051882124.1 CD99 antigen-like protein 2 isoform X3 [Pristis pectinata]
MMLFLRSLLLACLTFVVVRANEADEFDLSDALSDDSYVPTDDNDGFDLNDALQDDTIQPRGKDEFDLSDALKENPNGAPEADGFDLSDALDDSIKLTAGGEFDDSDLEYVKNSGYEPDKTNSKGQDPPGQQPPEATDLFSDLLMTILGGTSEQFKKICFSLLEMLNDLYNTQQDQ